MLAHSRSILLSSLQTRTRAVVARAVTAAALVPRAQTGAAIRHYSKPVEEDKPKLDQVTMGQKSSGRSSSRLIFGLHPFAIFASLTLLGSGYMMIIKPFLEWNEKTKDERGKQDKTASAKAAYTKEQVEQFPFDKKTVVFVLGGPGSGKGTNSEKLVHDFGFVHLSAGDLLRAEQKREVSQYGELIAHYIREGLIVPHEITIGLLRNAMMDHPDCDRFLIDGFPRNLVQAKAFEDTVCRAQKVLYFECPEAVMLDRLLNRGKTSGRTDDNIESIKKRFNTYVNDSKPVIDAYAKDGKVITVSCQGSVNDVYKNAHDHVAQLFKDIGQEAQPKPKIAQLQVA
ncbi:bifunctional uridylate/adenylate kinase [Coemansia thaxteri]|uniref:Uridylate kinase n=1 Tax=Coemansia thaxteri TaxID=2663907 RepID=A0A9W8EEQ0_9FUNG|nr:bifunctional uridylate/adenylate kinase [Coemansia thaxteri]KAJ2004251.1 bifunctional uridylate/adenylate kinase [Coemansia thaxteri]KAJ2471191.1 bifunctional uridylate/adenylate kinase [Coemansia sp. RSA 2322]KAJ2486343.1 bifunctional uridylate/adenylate kinase [Coemansia sp. RSA 2320]